MGPDPCVLPEHRAPSPVTRVMHARRGNQVLPRGRAARGRGRRDVVHVVVRSRPDVPAPMRVVLVVIPTVLLRRPHPGSPGRGDAETGGAPTATAHRVRVRAVPVDDAANHAPVARVAARTGEEVTGMALPLGAAKTLDARRDPDLAAAGLVGRLARVVARAVVARLVEPLVARVDRAVGAAVLERFAQRLELLAGRVAGPRGTQRAPAEVDQPTTAARSHASRHR